MRIFEIDKDLWVIDADNGELSDAIKMCEWLNGRFNHDVPFKDKPEIVMKRNAIIGGVLVSFLILVWLIYNLLMDQRVWLFVALAVHIICTAGIAFINIHGRTWFKRDGDGNIIEYIYRDRGDQWGAEGFMISCLTTTIGMTYVLLSRAHK